MASLRLAAPRAGFTLHSKQLQQLRLLPSVRYASTTPPPKPRVLEKPDKFRPPSHPSRLRSKPKYQYGPDLSQEQKTKRYPHMMPPEGTFLHWFLTNRSIHVWISMVRYIIFLCIRPVAVANNIKVCPSLVDNRNLDERFSQQHPIPRPSTAQFHVLGPSIPIHGSLDRSLRYARCICERADR